MQETDLLVIDAEAQGAAYLLARVSSGGNHGGLQQHALEQHVVIRQVLEGLCPDCLSHLSSPAQKTQPSQTFVLIMIHKMSQRQCSMKTVAAIYYSVCMRMHRWWCWPWQTIYRRFAKSSFESCKTVTLTRKTWTDSTWDDCLPPGKQKRQRHCVELRCTRIKPGIHCIGRQWPVWSRCSSNVTATTAFGFHRVRRKVMCTLVSHFTVRIQWCN